MVAALENSCNITVVGKRLININAMETVRCCNPQTAGVSGLSSADDDAEESGRKIYETVTSSA